MGKYVTISTIAGNDIVNAAEAAGNVAVSGTVGGDAKAGDIVTLTVGSNSYTATVQSDLSYSASVPGSVLASNASVGASVSSTDVNGNPAVGTSSHAYSVDTTAAAPVIC